MQGQSYRVWIYGAAFMIYAGNTIYRSWNEINHIVAIVGFIAITLFFVLWGIRIYMREKNGEATSVSTAKYPRSAVWFRGTLLLLVFAGYTILMYWPIKEPVATFGFVAVAVLLCLIIGLIVRRSEKESRSLEDLLLFTIPDEMREMTAEEAAGIQKAREESYGLRNEEKHTTLVISCKKRPLLIGRTASLEACLKKTEANVKKEMPSYEHMGYGSKLVDGKEIPTFEFYHMVQGNRQRGKYGLCFAGNYFLAFGYICGEDYVDFAEQKYDELLASVKFK